jgi:hypothetical protein
MQNRMQKYESDKKDGFFVIPDANASIIQI